MTHFLFTAVPWNIFHIDSSAVLGGVFKEMARNLHALFWEGLQVKGVRYYFAVIGVKGDAEFHVDAGEFLRSYMTVGHKNNLYMCSECEADDNFGDVSDNPVWLATVPWFDRVPCFYFYRTQYICCKLLGLDLKRHRLCLWSCEVGSSVPWDASAPPPLCLIPFSGDEFPAFLYKRDMFHIIKHGVGREACASILLMLGYHGYFDDVDDAQNVPDRLTRAFKTFKLWCEVERKSTSLKNFTRANLHYAKATSFPYLGGKGHDVTLVLMFLDFFLRLCLLSPKNGDRTLLSAMSQLVEGTLNYLGVMHSHELWLPNGCTGFMYKQGLKALRAYSYCAKVAMQSQYRLFCMRPKFHSWAHTVFELKWSFNEKHESSLSPCAFNCEQNEDFIGRVSRISRHVSPRLTILRTLQRYGVAVKARLNKMKKKRG